MAISNEGGQAEIMEMLQKVLHDNGRLHREIQSLGRDVASLRRDNSTIAMNLQTHRGTMGGLHVGASEDQATLASDMASSHHDFGSIQGPSERSHTHAGAKFKFFPRLPPELRLRIWKITCFNEPRVIRLRVHAPKGQPLFYCHGNCPPAILHATSESRREALNWYKRRAVDFWKYRDGRYGERIHIPAPETYMNFDIDILHPVFDEYWKTSFTGNWVEVLMKHRTIRQFRRVAVANNPEVDGFAREWTTSACFLAKPRSKIEEIFVIHGPTDFLETEFQLTPLARHDSISEYEDATGIELYSTVGNNLEEISKFLADAASDGPEGAISEDDVSENDDERSNAISRAKSNEKSQGNQPKKPPPKVVYMTLKEVHPQGSRWASTRPSREP